MVYFSTFGFTGGTASLVDFPEAQYNVYPIVQIIDWRPAACRRRGNWLVGCHYVESAGLLQGQSQTNPLLIRWR